jgi:hypothetical protein
MSQEKIKKMFNDLSAEEQSVLLLELTKSKKEVHIDTSNISAFATKHQKEYGKDITFTVKKDNLGFIEVILHTIFGNFKGVGSNQKIAKQHAVMLANEAWDG